MRENDSECEQGGESMDSQYTIVLKISIKRKRWGFAAYNDQWIALF